MMTHPTPVSSRPSALRQRMRQPVNRLLSSLGVRVVNAHWGPAGFQESFRRLRQQGVRPKQIVDIGASDGTWTRECLTVFPEARYFLVDPLAGNIPALKHLNREQPNVQFWSGALGRQTGELPLFEHGDQSSFLTSEFKRSASQNVEVRPLDAFLGSDLMDPPHLIKADVQGFELEVLQGATQCLRTAELLLLEVSYRRLYAHAPLAHEVIAFVAGLGFRILDICSYTQRARDGLLAQSDLLFAKADSALFEHEGWT